MKKNPKISVGIVLFRGEKFLKKCVKSLFEQKNYSNLEILLCDHSPRGEAKKFLLKTFPNKKFVLFSRRGNHSSGHNFLLEKARGDFYFCGSFDAIYPPDFFENLLKCAEKNPDFDFFAPKLFLPNGKIDSTGIEKKPFFRFADRGHGQKDRGQFDDKTEIFGASGAAFLARKSAILKIKRHFGFFFDENLHFKNDVDLAFRTQILNIKTRFCPAATMTHDRGTRQKNAAKRENSFFGHRVVFVKFGRSFSDFLGQFFRNFFAIFLAPKSFSQFRKWQKNRKK